MKWISWIKWSIEVILTILPFIEKKKKDDEEKNDEEKNEV